MIAVMVILATMLFVYLKPAERLNQARMADRATVKRELKNALKQYALQALHPDDTLDGLVSDDFMPICRYGVPPPEDAEGEPLCVSLDELVNQDILPEIPEDEFIAAREEFSGYEARMDCVGNMYVSFDGDPEKPQSYIPVDVNGDGVIDIEDYKWDCENDQDPLCRNKDIYPPPDGDGIINWQDHREWTKKFQGYCGSSCTCQETRVIDAVYVIDTSYSFHGEWATVPDHIREVRDVFNAQGYTVNTFIYALPPPSLQIKGGFTSDGRRVVGLDEKLAAVGKPNFCKSNNLYFQDWATDGNCPRDCGRVGNTSAACSLSCNDYPGCTGVAESEAWGLGARRAMQKHRNKWNPGATRIMFLIGDQLPHGGSIADPFISQDVDIAEDVKDLAKEEGISLFAIHGDWENASYIRYGSPTVHDFAELMTLPVAEACGQLVDYHSSHSNLYGAIFSYFVEACFINCSCQN